MSVTDETNTFLVGDLEAEALNRPKNVHLVRCAGFPRAKSQGGIIKGAFFTEIF
jgi:hypothetical protein